MKFNPTYYYGFGPEKSSKEALDKKSLKKTLKDFIEKGILSTVFGIDEKDIDLSELNDLDNENEEGGDEDQGFFNFFLKLLTKITKNMICNQNTRH